VPPPSLVSARRVCSTPLWQYVLASLVIAAATIGAYANTLGNDFVTWDDADYVYANPLLPAGLGAIWGDFTAEEPHEQYYPMVFTSFWIEYCLVKTEPYLYHATQMVLHAANAVLLILVFRQLGVRYFPSVLAAALFALHPINVCSVAWVTERKNTLSELFVLLALLLYLRFRRRAGWWRYATALLFFALALLSKSAVISLVPILIITDRLLDGRWALASLKRAVPFLVIAMIMTAVTLSAERRQAKSGKPLDPQVRPFVAAAALTHYGIKLANPTELLPVYPRWSDNPATVLSEPRYVVSTLLVITTAVLVYVYRRKLGATVLWGLAVFVLMAFPTLGLKNFNFLQFSFVSDHFIYHGTPGVFLAFAVLLDRLRRGSGFALAPGETAVDQPSRGTSTLRTAGVVLVAAAILVTCAALTVRQNRVWKNGVTMWEHTLRGNPDCFPANQNLGNHYARNGDFETALGYFQETIRIDPTHILRHRDCAHCCRELGRVADAIDYYRRALHIAEETNRLALRTHTEYADYLFYLGRWEDARREYEAILRKRPDHARARTVLQQLRGY